MQVKASSCAAGEGNFAGSEMIGADGDDDLKGGDGNDNTDVRDGTDRCIAEVESNCELD